MILFFFKQNPRVTPIATTLYLLLSHHNTLMTTLLLSHHNTLMNYNQMKQMRIKAYLLQINTQVFSCVVYADWFISEREGGGGE